MQSINANVNWGVQTWSSTPDLQAALDIVWVHLEKDLDLRETSSCGRCRDAGKGDRGKEGSQQEVLGSNYNKWLELNSPEKLLEIV